MKRAVVLCLAMSAACSSTPTPATAPSSSRQEVLQLLEAAEASHHCAGEEADNDKRRAELATCVEDNLKTARALLPGVVASSSMQPSTLAVVRLYVEPALSAEERQKLCATVPPEDFLDGLLDDEARAGCGVTP